MNKLKVYAAVAGASAAMVAGGEVGYQHFAEKTAPGIQQCTDKYVRFPKLLDRCTENVPFSSGRIMMSILALTGIAGLAGSGGFALNETRKSLT